MGGGRIGYRWQIGDTVHVLIKRNQPINIIDRITKRLPQSHEAASGLPTKHHCLSIAERRHHGGSEVRHVLCELR